MTSPCGLNVDLDSMAHIGENDKVQKVYLRQHDGNAKLLSDGKIFTAGAVVERCSNFAKR